MRRRVSCSAVAPNLHNKYLLTGTVPAMSIMYSFLPDAHRLIYRKVRVYFRNDFGGSPPAHC
jgi:hypothetical protein